MNQSSQQPEEQWKLHLNCANTLVATASSVISLSKLMIQTGLEISTCQVNG